MAPSLLVASMVAFPVRIASMVAFPVKFRLYLPAGELRVVKEPDRDPSRMPPLLLVVDVLVVDALVVQEPGLHREASSMVSVVLVVPALGWPLDALLGCLLLVLVVVLGVPPAVSAGAPWSSCLRPRKAGGSLQPVP